MKKYVAEFLGAFALVFIGAGAVLVNSLTNGAVGLIGIAVAHGFVLMPSVYSFAHISGSHFNPAVTITMWVQKRIKSMEALGYIVSQLLGAVFAALLLRFLYPQATAAALYGFPLNIDLVFGIVLEAILTFFLVMSIYGTAVNKKAPSPIFGLVIGSTILVDILMAGTQTGAAMNPARAFGPALVSGLLDNQLIYWIGPIVGGLIASFVYTYLDGETKMIPDPTTNNPMRKSYKK